MPRKRDDTHGGGDPLKYATGYHAPVLCNAVVEGLITDRSGTYVDGTLGGGGHTAALLEALAPEGRVIGIDQDADALDAARERLHVAVEQDRLITLRGNFGDLHRLLGEIGIDVVAGVLLDLGVSSHQIDVGARGFSYGAEGALDMRMDQRSDLTADHIVNAWSVNELRRVLREYGEEPQAGRIARAIAEARPVQTTAALADIVRGQVWQREELKTLARVFQGIRIAVNRELDVLEQALDGATRTIRPGGRIAVISYHSLEDRRVKRYLRYGNLAGKPVHDFYGNLISPWKDLTRRPVEASQTEVAANSRARSARLRIAERTDHEA